MICIYEDETLYELSPLVDLRPVCDLRCGRFTLLEKMRRLYPRDETHLWVREGLAGLVAEKHPDCRVNQPIKENCLFLSGALILRQRVKTEGEEAILVVNNRIAGFRLRAEKAEKFSSGRTLRVVLPQEQVDGVIVARPWDVVELNPGELSRECAQPFRGRKKSVLPAGVIVVGSRQRLGIAAGARVWPGVVISTETGPVMIDRHAQIRPGSFLEGPCYVGPGTIIDGAKVRPGCSFGPACRIGGEVEASVFQGYANKQHEGFIGHSYVGEWVNLGALTTNSDLKNAYEPVRVFYGGRPVDTGLLKVGCFVGDHAKTAIGTLLNTGTRIGTFANWFESGLSPREIPAFYWPRTCLTAGKKGAGVKRKSREEGRWKEDEAVECARRVMARRGVEMTGAYERALRWLYGSAVRVG